MRLIGEGPVTAGEMLLMQKWTVGQDMVAAMQLVAGRAGLSQAQVEALDYVEFLLLVSRTAAVLSQAIERQNALLAAQALMSKEGS